MDECYLEFKKRVMVKPAIEMGEKNQGPLVFRQPAKYDAKEITSEVCVTGDKIVSQARFEMAQSDIDTLSEFGSESELPAKLVKKIRNIEEQLGRANARLLDLIQQELRVRDSLIRLFDGLMQWSKDGKTWHEAPGFKIVFSDIELFPIIRLDEKTQRQIQAGLDRIERPMIAMLHLREAQQLRGRRFRWIEATIAAELAIKEALIRLEPKFETLLLEVPSPPLGKLYGSVLESVTGEKSPYASQLHRGAQKRNEIVHRPATVTFEKQEVADYVAIVNEAIYHLMDLTRRFAVDRTAGNQSS